MTRPGFMVFVFCAFLAACTPAPSLAAQPTPSATAIPAAGLPTPEMSPTVAPAATVEIVGNLFLKISHSADVLHLECDPLEIIFSVTAGHPQVDSVVFFFRMKDKASGLVNPWSNVKMRPAGNDMFEYILKTGVIPNEARYWNAWLQYQFVAFDNDMQRLGQTQIFGDQIDFSPTCP